MKFSHKTVLIICPLLARSVAAQNDLYLQIPSASIPVGMDGPWWGFAIGQEPLSQYDEFEWIAFPYGGAYSQFADGVWDLEKLAPSARPWSDNVTYPWTQLLNRSEITSGNTPAGVTLLNQSWYDPRNIEGDGLAQLAALDELTQIFAWGNYTRNISDSTDDVFTKGILLSAQMTTGQGSGSQTQKNSSAQFNTSIVAWGSPYFELNNGTRYLLSAPLLGLGGISQGKTQQNAPAGLTAEAKKSGAIGAEFFGLHVGSVEPEIPPSLYLGGYDSNRAYGRAGVFGYESFGVRDFVAEIAMIDLKLGTQTGGSPFNFTEQEKSILGTVNPPANANLGAELGAGKNSIGVGPNPAAPYIQLPFGVCDRVASYLPVHFDNATGFYLWRTDDPAYKTIVQSPAYLEFVFFDIKQMNISIKVPFQLLNLTLEAPMINGTTLQYFPCTGSLSPEIGFLGRAFLQAAYFGIQYEQNRTILAQAPGPGLNQKRNITQMNPSDQNITTIDISQWEATWSEHWTPLPASGTSPSSPAATDASAASQASKIGLGVGLGVGIPAVAAIGLLGSLAWRRRKNANNRHAKGQGISIMDQPPPYQDAPKAPAADHMDQAQEVDGASVTRPMPPAEMGESTAAVTYGMSANNAGPLVSELPADFHYQELPTPERGVSRGNSRGDRTSLLNTPSALSPNTDRDPDSARPVSAASHGLSPGFGPHAPVSPRRASNAGSLVSLE